MFSGAVPGSPSGLTEGMRTRAWASSVTLVGGEGIGIADCGIRIADWGSEDVGGEDEEEEGLGAGGLDGV